MNVKKLAMPILREALPSEAKYNAMCAEVDKMVELYRPRLKSRPWDQALREQLRQEVFPVIDKVMKVKFKIDKRAYDLRIVLSVSEAMVQSLVDAVTEEICQEKH